MHDNRAPRELHDAAVDAGESGAHEELVVTIRRIVREELHAAAPAAGEMLTIAQAAALAGYGVTKIREWLKSGTLRRFGEGRGVRVSRRELQAVMARQQVLAVTDEDIERMAERALRRSR